MSQEKLQTMVMQKFLGCNRCVLCDCASCESTNSSFARLKFIFAYLAALIMAVFR